MIQTDQEILKLMKTGEIKIENFIPENLGPVSYDLTIDEVVRVVHRLNGYKIDITKRGNHGMFKHLPINLKYGESLVFTTQESIYVGPSITGIIHQRSSLTKLPILFNIAGLVDPGFNGTITGVIYNLSFGSIEIKKMRICQIIFHKHNKVKTDYSKRKSSKNLNQSGVNSLISEPDIEFRTP